MKATALLNRYAKGDRDFRHANLRGQHFKGQDLSGADFSEADIRGTNFTNANLRGANFTGATAGVQKRWVFGQIVLVVILANCFGALIGYLGVLYANLLNSSNTNLDYLTTVIAVVSFLAPIIPITCQGLTDSAAANLSFAVAGVIGITVIFTNTFIGASSILNTLASVVIGSVTGVVISTGSIVIATTVASRGIIPCLVATVTVISSTYFFTNFGASAIASVAAALIAYFTFQSQIGNKKFSQVLIGGMRFAATGGTSFCGADLTCANFNHADLKRTRLYHTKQKRIILKWVCWKNVKNLNCARVGDSILSDAQVRQLLITRNGYNQSYINANLRGANLDGVNLESANLTGADLSEASLHHANLKNGNLREVLAIGTNFTGAYLTGACLEAWNIDHTTKLDQVDCQYIFLLEHPNPIGSRERRPHDPDQVFAPGDFETLYKKMMNVVQILLRNGVNREAFATAFQKLMDENPEITHDSIQAMEKKGNDVLLTLAVPEKTDKGKIAQDFLQPYQAHIQLLESRNEELKLRATKMEDLAIELARKPIAIHNQVIGAGNPVNDNRSINVGGDLNMSGSTLNLGDISGTVTNAINQLPISPDPTQPGIKELLAELQAEIETSADLSADDKKDALEQVKILAELGQNPNTPETEGIGRKAIKLLKGTVASLPETTKIVEASTKLLPWIARILGLPV